MNNENELHTLGAILPQHRIEAEFSRRLARLLARRAAHDVSVRQPALPAPEAASRAQRQHGRAQSPPEELANALSHGLGLAAALAGAVFLVVAAVQRGSVRFGVGAGVFAASMVVLYSASTLYHALPPGRAKRLLLVCDHAAIYLLIAGTYTPFTLGVLWGGWGWTLFGLVWGLAAAGVVFKVVGGPARFPLLSTGLYLGMGWLFLVVGGPVWQLMPRAGMLWLLAGGIAYTIGVWFFVREQVRYNHLIWHLFVLAGTACHFVAVWQSAV